MLLEKYPIESIAGAVVSHADYAPFPTADNRAPWDSLPAEMRSELIERGAKRLGYAWPMLPATNFLEFTRTGNRSHYEALYFARRGALIEMVLAECLEGKGRFLDDIGNGIWCICEESTWALPAHNWIGKGVEPLPDTQQPFVDLFAAETGALMALTHYLLHTRLDAISPRVSERIRRETKTRILDPYLEREHFWMGFGAHVNNWTVWCNSNCLLAFLALEENQERRVQAVGRAMRITDNFLNVYPKDGGCDEGPGYWNVAGGSLFDCLEHLWAATKGRIDVWGEPLIGEIGRYIVRAHVSGKYMINFADAAARTGVNGDLVYRFGKRIGDAGMMGLGAYAFRETRSVSFGYSLNRVLLSTLGWKEIDEAKAEPPYLRDVWMSGIQVMAAREKGGSDKGLYLAAKGGHNAESHNHNDVGHFILYADGRPILIDVGVGTYTKQTFSAQRYELWYMQSQYHNLPTVNGVQQSPGGQYKAADVSYTADDSLAQLSLNIAAAYSKDAGVAKWQRTSSLTRLPGPAVEIVEDFALAKPSSDVSLNLVTPCKADVSSPGIIVLQESTGVKVRIDYDAAKLAAAVETVEVDDAKLVSAWGKKLYRIVLRPMKAVDKDTWRLRGSCLT